MAAALAWAIGRRSVWALLAAPILGVVPCWLGHLWFEGNRPTSWTRPADSILGTLRRLSSRERAPGAARGRFYYSFLADLKMCGAMLASAVRSEPKERT